MGKSKHSSSNNSIGSHLSRISLSSTHTEHTKREIILPPPVEVEQLKNIMINYLTCDQFDYRVQMEPHIMTVLKFTDEEVVKAEKARETIENFFINPKSWGNNLKTFFGGADSGKKQTTATPSSSSVP